jgi:hypothetical protein
MSGAGIRRVAEKETSIAQLPENIKQFIERTPWTFAKTYAKTWPHEYIVQEKVDPYPAMEKTMSRTFRVGLVAAT